MQKFTVVGTNPDGTSFVEHVNARDPAAAERAIFEDSDRPPEETTIVGIFAGHLEDLHA
jgi:hypothetical protein